MFISADIMVLLKLKGRPHINHLSIYGLFFNNITGGLWLTA